jgi:cytochrome d ubiquinol oxidase subunit I
LLAHTLPLKIALVIFKGMYLRTKDKHWEQLTKFRIKIFALLFGIGVVTEIVTEFEFGTNRTAYSGYVVDIFGSALASEGVFAGSPTNMGIEIRVLEEKAEEALDIYNSIF